MYLLLSTHQFFIILEATIDEKGKLHADKRRYVFLNSAMSWKKAKEYCFQFDNFSLDIVKTQIQFSVLKKYSSAYGGKYFFCWIY